MNEETQQGQQPEKKKKGPSLVLIGVVVALLIVGIWVSKDPAPKKPIAAPAKTTAEAKPTEEPPLAGLGKTLGVGPAALAVSMEKTEVVDPATLEGMNAALDGFDVEAFIALLEEAGIEQVLVDPNIARRNPIPKATVRNRLALTHPAGRLNAYVASQRLVRYRLVPEPPVLDDTARKALIRIARDTFAGGKGTVPDDAPPIITKKGDWTMLLVVRPVQSSHISYHATGSGTMAQTAARLGEKARKYFLKRKRFAEEYGPLELALPQMITLEMELAYDWGTFFGPRDSESVWRWIEPGINGFRVAAGGESHYMPPWYSVANNLRTVEMLLERVVGRNAGLDRDAWKRADMPIDRFRTFHWRETTPGGEIEDLYRNVPGITTMKDVTREKMIETLVGLNDWIADNQRWESGRYVYRYFPTKDEENDEYNMVRHCLGPFSMALTQEYVPNPKHKEKADAGMKFIESHIRWGGPPRQGDGTIDTALTSWQGKPLPGDDVALMEYAAPPRGDWSAKMGGVAVSILGYTQYKRVGWEWTPEKQRVLDGLANFLVYMHDEQAGHFHHYYVAPKNGYYGTRNSIYPGEILYAVARLYGETKDEKYRKLFKESLAANLEWFKGQMAQRRPDGTYEERHRKNLVQFQPWMAMAMDEMYRYDQDPAYVEASNLVSLWILDTFQFDETRAFYPDYVGGYMKVLDELPAMHTFVYTEGVAASFDLARRAGAPAEVVEKLRRGALLAARFMIQQQTRFGVNDFYYPNPRKAKGAVRYCMNHNKQRIDYTYHALSAAYRIIRAATDEDYAWAQSVELPPRY